MSAEAIPVEILELIFKNLKGTEVAACRAVCRRWRDVIDNFSDDIWKQYCCRDFCNPITARAKTVSSLSHRELYKSLSLWSKVEEAEEICHTLPVMYVKGFKVLNNNTLAVLSNDVDDDAKQKNDDSCNVIEYYNIQTMELISSERHAHTFFSHLYDENDKLIVLVYQVELSLYVITKSNKKKFYIGNNYALNKECSICFTDMDLILLDTEVYFKNGRKVCVARLKVVNGQETVEKEELKKFDFEVIAFASVGDNKVNILTKGGGIYCYREKDFEKIYQIGTQNIIYKLWQYGFHYSDEQIYGWLSFNFDKEQLKITKVPNATLHTHNHIVLLGTRPSTVHVYKQPYNENGELKLYEATPNRIIHLGKYIPRLNRKQIRQLDVVESVNGHRLLVRCSKKLIFIDLLHIQHKEEREKYVCKKPRLILLPKN